MCIVNEELEQLYLENAPKLINYFISKNKDSAKFFDTLEDMRQALLLKVWQKLPKYNKSKGKFSTYVYIICSSETSQQIRQMQTNKRRLCLEVSSLDQEVQENISLIDILGIDENYHEKYCSYEQYMKVLGMLNEDARLYFTRGYNYREIAELKGVTIAAVGRSVRRNLAKIRRQIDQENQSYEPD